MQNLIYVNIVGKNADDEYVYEFYFSEEPEMCWNVDWDIKPASICNLSVPQKMNYDVIKTLKTDIILSVAQKNSCFSMQDCKDGIVPVAWENIDLYTAYPEDGRVVLPFGMELSIVEQTLSKRGLFFEGDTNNETFDF